MTDITRGSASGVMEKKRPLIHRARAALDRWSTEHPDIGRDIDEYRHRIAKESPWPAYVFLPLRLCSHVIDRYLSRRGRRIKPGATLIERQQAMVRPTCELMLFSSWRVTQGIYRFDPTLYEALTATPITGEIPGELLRHLPEWCVYIETPGLTAPTTGGPIPVHGVWAWLDDAPEFDILTLGLDTDHGIPISHVPLSGTLDDGLRILEDQWTERFIEGALATAPLRGYAKNAGPTVAPILSLLLYLCSEEPEIGEDRVRPSKPLPKHTKQGERIFPADSLKTWNVGVRMGAALRRAYEARDAESDPTGRRLKPHVRSMHWHTFRKGRMRSERKVMWLPPIPVNVSSVDELPAVIKTR